MNVILGATGKVGEAAARELRRRGQPVRAVMRDPRRGEGLARAGCELATAQLADRATLVEALHGAHGVLVVCPVRPTATDVEAEAGAIVEAVGAALEQVRPRRIVAISDYGAQHAEGTGIAGVFHRLERRLEPLEGLTCLRSAEHMENAVRLLGVASKRGVWPSLHHPLDRRYPMVAKRDVGLRAAELLCSPGPRVVHVEGPARMSSHEVAALVAAQLGRAVEAVAVPVEQWEPSLMASGLSADHARLIAEMQRAHHAGRIEVEAGGERRLGATSLAEVLLAR